MGWREERAEYEQRQAELRDAEKAALKDVLPDALWPLQLELMQIRWKLDLLRKELGDAELQEPRQEHAPFTRRRRVTTVTLSTGARMAGSAQRLSEP
jgi:hypothetical protein